MVCQGSAFLLEISSLTHVFAARASIEEEYARKMMNLCRKPLGSQETGTLKTSLDTVRGEVEQMAKQHQNISAEMKSELEEPLAAFTGGMKERRKIIQNTVEKLLKTKTQQTQHVNKVRQLTIGASSHMKVNAAIDSRQVRARVPEDQGLLGSGPHGHGPRRASEQGEARKDANQPRNLQHRIRECCQSTGGYDSKMEPRVEGGGRQVPGP